MATAASGIEEIRREIATLRAEREAVRGAPVPLDEARAALNKMLTTWATVGQARGVHVDHLIAQAMAGTPPTTDELYRAASLGTVLALLAPLLRQQLHDGIETCLTERYAQVKAGLPAAARERRLAELDGEIATLERDEEESIQAAAEGGLAIDRRADASPAVVLGLPE